MASIFTFEPEPPRVASPWLHNIEGYEETTKVWQESRQQGGNPALDSRQQGILPQAARRRLQAEPQDGPVEYKLHLLLRPRRKFRSTSTGTHISGSRHSRPGVIEGFRSTFESVLEHDRKSGDAAPPASSTNQTRQHRLQQLTTQLLWRLQQSSPHHSSSASNMILPSLPEALPELQAPVQPAKLLHGLEESHGALYEIGVSDDGTLIGLAEDEMEESLNNLRAMAACLGCVVEVLRKEVVGDCEWVEDAQEDTPNPHTGLLYVVEAFVKPCLQRSSPRLVGQDATQEGHGEDQQAEANGEQATIGTEQLRVTLTGPTMSGKSTLLGTLTMSTFDNGRGKSRLSMLKHRHEITSGVTSSVTQELVGFKEANAGNLDVLNYATDSVVSWIDTHVAAAGNRLVLITDSAGHPRYRRTTIRGLVGWSPHWTLLCIPADDTENTAGMSGSTLASQQDVGGVMPDMDLSGAQLDLCLRLRLPLVVVITKLDLASKPGLKASLTKVLDAVKAAGKQPVILKNSHAESSEAGLQYVDSVRIEAAYQAAIPLLNDPTGSVPIVLTSAVLGTGIETLQALLHELPILPTSADNVSDASFVFHIEDTYNNRADADGVIISGLLRSGQLSVGDSGVIGPFSTHDLDDSEDSDDRSIRRPAAHLPTSRSFPGALRHAALPRFQIPGQEWRRFKVRTIRNLRLPVHTLLADQVGTIAVVPDIDGRPGVSAMDLGRIRKGMVFTAMQPQAIRSFGAEFRREGLEHLAVGNHVVVYVCSVRASARVVSARVVGSSPASQSPLVDRTRCTDVPDSDQPPVGSFHAHRGALNENESVAGAVTRQNLVVQFKFDATKEYLTVGDQVLVMPGGGPGLYGGHERGEKGLAGLDGFVGRIVETFA